MQILYPLYWKLKRIYCFLFRPVTLGVKAIIFDDQERVLLVKHSYIEGWHLPGGAIDRGETALAAVKREIAEEVGIVCKSDPQIVPGLFFNTYDYKNDHIALFVLRDWGRDDSLRHAGEIVADQFFALDQMPADVSRGSKRRVQLFFENPAQGFEW